MIAYDRKTALIVVDVQNDFADENGSLYVDEGEHVIPVINEEVARALEASVTVVYTQDWHPETTPHFQKDGGTWPVHCVMGSWGAELHPRLVVKGPVVQKGSRGDDGYSGFTERDPVTEEERPTRLESLLREKGIERVVVAGLATDYCVKETALDALRRGFHTAVLSNGVRAVNLAAGDGDAALDQIREAGGRVE